MSKSPEEKNEVIKELNELSPILRAIKEWPVDVPGTAYFEQMESDILFKIKREEKVKAGVFEIRYFMKAAAAVIIMGASIWMYLSYQPANQPLTDFVFSDEELLDYLLENVDEIDRELIYATARDERDIRFYLEDQNMEVEALEFLINHSDEFDQNLIEY